MDKCEIPLALLTGDTMTNDSVSNEGALLAYFDGANELLKPIGDRLLQIKGNHDDVYGSYTVNGNTTYYVNKVSANKVWNKMFRKQATNFNRVFGGNGYFYVDNIPQKTRFICLNGHYYDGEAITNGTTRAMSSGFGAEQLNWLASAALPVDKEGWSVVIATHCPPTAATINGVNYYLSQIPDGNDFRNIITAYCNKTGDFANKTVAGVAGIFCGHCHADAIVTDDLPCPIITVTTCNDFAYDGTSRTKNSNKETALDIVSINKKTGFVNLTRLGAGNDRVVTYKVVK